MEKIMYTNRQTHIQTVIITVIYNTHVNYLLQPYLLCTHTHTHIRTTFLAIGHAYPKWDSKSSS